MMESNEQKAAVEGTANIVLGGVTSKATGNVLEPSLHVDLVSTDLADFVEHFERELRGQKAGSLLGDNLGRRLWGDEPHPDSGKYTRVLPVAVGTTGKDYWIFEGGNGEPETRRAVVQVVRYRWLRVKIALHEHSGGYVERLKRWLDKRWEDAVIPNELDNAPEPDYALVKTERDLILYSLVYWATKRKSPRVTQKMACEKVGVKRRTYQDKKQKTPEIFLTDADIKKLGTTFKELWDIVVAGGDIEDILETDY